MGIVSTVPGAMLTLLGYMQQVADDNPNLDCGVYLGAPPTQAPKANYLMVGNWRDAQLGLRGYHQSWATITGANPGYRAEPYAVDMCIRTWSGSVTAQAAAARLDEAMTLFDGLLTALVLDIKGSGNLSSSGSWGTVDMEIPATGPVVGAGKGWGVVLDITVSVLNAQLNFNP